jgi:hypothetical protein
LGKQDTPIHDYFCGAKIAYEGLFNRECLKMKSTLIFGLLFGVFMMAQANFAHAHNHSQSCALEARAMITQTHAYKNASVREKQRLLRALNAPVRQALKACSNHH